MDFVERYKEFTRSDYQNDNFLAFLKNINFNYATPSIHIAGTNGKGTTASYIASIYKESGYKVGLFTSPYFYDTNEMIQINGKKISDEDIIEIMNQYYDLFVSFDLSLFEIETFIALNYFDSQKCDIAVIECGMGGLIDATNIFSPILAIITSVSLEHTNFLGTTIDEIAIQKAGIITNNIYCVIGELSQEAENAIARVAEGANSKVIRISKPCNIVMNDNGISFDYSIYTNIQIQSTAIYSTIDGAIAIEAITALQNSFHVSNDNMYKGLLNVKMSNRLDIVSKSPLMIIDGAHNPEAIEALVQTINDHYGNKIVHIVFACFRDKNITAILPTLSILSKDLVLTTFNHPRARKEEDYFLYLDEFPFVSDYLQVINDKVKMYKDDLILVTGSLAFAGVVNKAISDGKIKF